MAHIQKDFQCLPGTKNPEKIVTIEYVELMQQLEIKNE